MNKITSSCLKFLLLIVSIISSQILSAQLNTVLEAEDQTLTQTYIVKPGSGTASNGAWILLKNNPHGSLTLTVNDIPAAGTYKLNMYCFNNNVSQTATFSLNDGAASTITINPSTWEYQGPAQRTTLDLDLNAGTNTFTFTRIAQNLHFDYFTVTTEIPVATYYISNDGDDTNTGLSEDSPWKTLTKASTVLASGGMEPGGKLLFRKGDTFIGQLLVGCSGTEESPIEIGSYGSGNLPVLTGVGANLGNNNNGDAREVVIMTNTNHLLVNNLHVTNDRQVDLGWQGSGNSSFGIKVVANKWGGTSKGLTFRNLEFTDIFGVDMLDWEGKFTLDYYNAQAFFFDSEADDTSQTPTVEVGIDDVLIEDCYFYNLGGTAISVRNLNPANNPVSDAGRNENFVIRNNHFEKLGGDGVVFASVNNGLVENNEFIDLGWGDHTSQTDRYFGRGEGCWIWDSHNILVQYNKQYRASGFGDTYGAAGHVDFFCKNSVFQYNYSEDTEGGFVEILGDCENTTFRYNVSVNDGHRANGHHRYAIWVSGYVGTGNTPVPSNNNYIYNNTVYLDKTRSQPDIEIFAENTYIYNNLFYAMNGAKIGNGGVNINMQSGGQLMVSNNLFYGDIASAFTNLDAQKIIGQNPLFTNPVSDGGTQDNFNIQDGSPAIDAGKSFPQPVFPNAGVGIFKDIPMYPSVDSYGNPIDINNVTPNIGVSNAYNSDNLSVGGIENKLFSVYPNPVKDQMHINFTTVPYDAAVEVYDVQGKLVHATRIDDGQQQQQLQLPVTIKNGIYAVKITKGAATQTTQIILYR